VVVTAGGTREPIDPVRYIGNHSSGRMGFALAEEARDRGAETLLIVASVSAPLPQGIEIIHAETALELRDATLAAIGDADALVMAAAVADYRVERPAAHKIKKGSAEENTDGSLSLHLTQNPDILAEVQQVAEARGLAGLTRVGFAAETNDVERNAAAKLRRKGLHLLVANDVSQPDSGFSVSTNRVTLLYADGRVEHLPLMSKSEVARAIWDRLAPLLAKHAAGKQSR
jgi:phosphopantothenoylcysteine decarboxylase/phosphopantothenate--cysteine ligase